MQSGTDFAHLSLITKDPAQIGIEVSPPIILATKTWTTLSSPRLLVELDKKLDVLWSLSAIIKDNGEAEGNEEADSGGLGNGESEKVVIKKNEYRTRTCHALR